MEPTETTAAVVSGWALAWTLLTLGVPEVPAIVVGLLAWATTSGRYRRRWALPAAPPAPEAT